jgi:hypothetical protein
MAERGLTKICGVCEYQELQIFSTPLKSNKQPKPLIQMKQNKMKTEQILPTLIFSPFTLLSLPATSHPQQNPQQNAG